MDSNWHLSEKDFFWDLAEERKALLSMATRMEVRQNHFIFTEGESGDHAYYLEQGAVSIFRTNWVGKEPVVSLRKSGELFGLAEVVGGRERKCTARTIAPSIIYRIGKIDFEAVLSNHYKLARRVIQILGRRIRYLDEQLENFMVCDVTTRVLKLMVYLAYPEADKVDVVKNIKIPLKLTQEQIASMTGSCQQTVSVLLSRFQEEGLISIDKRHIVVNDLAKVFAELDQ